jgi:hypothetical protein
LISVLNPKLGEGVLVYTNNFLSRQIKAVPQLPIFENKNSNDSGTLKASITFSCPSPYWEDLEDTVVDIGVGQLQEIENNGDVPTQMKITLKGGAENPQIVNYTTNQKIGLEMQLSNLTVIETYTGKKRVYEETVEFVLEQYGGTITDILYKDDIVFFLGKTVSFIYDGVNLKSIKIGGNSIAYSEGIGLYCICGRESASYVSDIKISSDLINWRRVYVNVTGLNSIVATDTAFYAVGNNGVIITSTNGTSWSTESSGVSANLNSVANSGNNFIAVGDGGVIVTKSGTNAWQTRTSGTSENLNFVRFFNSSSSNVVGANGTVLYGLFSFSTLDIGTTEDLFYCFDDDRNYYFLGDNGTVIQHQKGYGTLNIPLSIPATSAVKVGGYSDKLNMYFYYATEGKLMGTYNNTTFENIVQGEAVRINDIINVNGVLYCVGEAGYIAKKENGVWKKIESGVQNNLYAICYAESKGFVIAGEEILLKSQDGVTWASVSEDFTYYRLVDLTYCQKDDSFYILLKDSGYTSQYILKTADLESFEAVYSEVGTQYDRHDWFQQIEYADDLDLFCVAGNNTVKTTRDFQDWARIGYSGIAIVLDLKYVKSEKLFYYTVHDGQYSINYVSTTNGDSYVSGNEKYLIVRDYVLSSERAVQCLCVSKEKGIVIGTTTIDMYYGGDPSSLSVVQGCGIGATRGVIDNDGNYVFVGEMGLIERSKTVELGNMISKLMPDSDMRMELAKGKNQFRLLREGLGTLSATISFRQKYIGV